MALDLRPLTLGELLDRGFTLYRRHVWLFVGIMAVPGVFGLAAAVLMQIYQTAMQSQIQPGVPATPEIATSTMVGYFLAMFLGSLIYMVVYTIALGATSVAVSELYVGRDATIGSAYTRARPLIGRLLLLMLSVTLRVGGLVLGGTMFAGIIGALSSFLGPVAVVAFMAVAIMATFLGAGYLMLRYSLSVPALVLEGLKANESLRRSVELVDGAKWRVLLLCVCALIVAYAGAALLQGPFLFSAIVVGLQTRTGFWLQMIGLVAGTIGQTFTTPIMIVGLVLQYYDSRIRGEALDIDLMLASLDAPPEPAAGVTGA